MAEKYAKKAEAYLDKAQEALRAKESAHATAEEYQEKAILSAEKVFESSEFDLAQKGS